MARFSVDITHLGLLPPTKKGRDNIQEKYYKKLLKLYKNTKAHVRRVERVSKDKIEWIELLIKDFDGITNFSLYCLQEQNPSEQKEMSDLLSIQKVDDVHIFIIALNEHRSISSQRDIYFKSKKLCEYFNKYYEKRLIEQSLPIIENGKVRLSNWLKIKERYS